LLEEATLPTQGGSEVKKVRRWCRSSATIGDREEPYWGNREAPSGDATPQKAQGKNKPPPRANEKTEPKV